MSADGDAGTNGDGRARRPGDRTRPDDRAAAPTQRIAARHRRGGGRDRVLGRPDRRSMVTRVPFVVALVAALAAAVAVDRSGGERPATAGAPAPGAAARVAVVSPPSDVGSSTWFCAAGTATEGGMAEHTVVMLNPTDRDLTATLTAFRGAVLDVASRPGAGSTAVPAAGPASRPTVTRLVALPAGERVTVALSQVIEAPLAAALVEVDAGGVAVEHEVRGPHGADVVPCTTTAASSWHFAWGTTTRDARELVVLFNPFPSPATVDAVFATPDGRREPVRFQGLPVPAGSVVGVDVGSEVTRSDQVAASFRARSGRIVVERLQQFDGSLGVEGLSLAPGVPAAADVWVFADGEASALAPAAPPPDAAAAGSPEASDDHANDDTSGSGTGGSEDGADTDEGTGEEGASDPDTGGDEDGADSDERTGEDGQDGDRGTGDPGVGDIASSERIVVYNPGDERSEVEVEVVPTTDQPGPAVPPFELSVRAGGYEVLDYGEHDRIVAGVHHATVVRATAGPPIVAERVTVDGAAAAGRPAGQPQTPAASAASDPPTSAEAPDGSDSSEAPEQRGGPGAATEEVTASSGARLAAPRWLFPSLAGVDGVDAAAVRVVVFNPDRARTLDVQVTPVGDPGPTAGARGAPPAVVAVGPGERVALDLDVPARGGLVAATVEAEGPVVVERTVVAGDGRRLVAGRGIPLADGAAVLSPLGDGGLLGPAYRP